MLTTSTIAVTLSTSPTLHLQPPPCTSATAPPLHSHGLFSASSLWPERWHPNSVTMTTEMLSWSTCPLSRPRRAPVAHGVSLDPSAWVHLRPTGSSFHHHHAAIPTTRGPSVMYPTPLAYMHLLWLFPYQPCPSLHPLPLGNAHPSHKGTMTSPPFLPPLEKGVSTCVSRTVRVSKPHFHECQLLPSLQWHRNVVISNAASSPSRPQSKRS